VRGWKWKNCLSSLSINQLAKDVGGVESRRRSCKLLLNSLTLNRWNQSVETIEFLGCQSLK
jgi:hypothetical protein